MAPGDAELSMPDRSIPEGRLALAGGATCFTEDDDSTTRHAQITESPLTMMNISLGVRSRRARSRLNQLCDPRAMKIRRLIDLDVSVLTPCSCQQSVWVRQLRTANDPQFHAGLAGNDRAHQSGIPRPHSVANDPAGLVQGFRRIGYCIPNHVA